MPRRRHLPTDHIRAVLLTCEKISATAHPHCLRFSREFAEAALEVAAAHLEVHVRHKGDPSELLSGLARGLRGSIAKA